jgi:hypothetical protein
LEGTVLASLSLNDLILGCFTFIGASGLYVVNRIQDQQPFSLFSAVNVEIGNSADSWIIVCDLVVSCLLGSVIVYFIARPSTVPQAITVGLGMTGLLSANSTTLE